MVSDLVWDLLNFELFYLLKEAMILFFFWISENKQTEMNRIDLKKCVS